MNLYLIAEIGIKHIASLDITKHLWSEALSGDSEGYPSKTSDQL